MKWAEPIAFGPLNLDPRTFEELQPHEFYSLIEGYIWRKHERQNETAYFVAEILNMSGRMAQKRIKAEDLVKPLQAEKKKERNVKEDLTHLRKVFKGRME